MIAGMRVAPCQAPGGPGLGAGLWAANQKWGEKKWAPRGKGKLGG